MHPDLTKMQGMLGAKMPYKEVEEILERELKYFIEHGDTMSTK